MDTFDKLVKVMNHSDISFMDKIAIIASLQFVQDALNGKHGEDVKDRITKEIGRKFCEKVSFWKIPQE